MANEIPAGWRRSQCQTTRGDPKVPFVETFTTGTVDEELGTDIGPASDVVYIRSEDAAGLTALLGETISGVLCTDRWAVYDRLPPERRQVCWAHLKRDFQKLVDRGGPAARLGERLGGVQERVFREWRLFRGGGLDRAALQRRLDGPARELERLLRRGRRW